MSVTVGSTVVQADHHKLMLTASPLGRSGEILEHNHGHGVVGYLLGRKQFTRAASITLTVETLAQYMHFNTGAVDAIALTFPTVPDLCARYNLQDGSYIELLINNVGATNNGVLTLTAAASSGFTVRGTAAFPSTRVGKVGIYIKDRTSTVNADGGDIFLL